VPSRWVCLDVGETLIDETRIWSLWADELGIPRLTFMAAFGAAVARGGEHHDVFRIVGRADWREHLPAVIAAYGGFQEHDLYADARTALGSLRHAGYRIALVANQPAERTAELRALGIEADVIAMSDEMGVHKPEPAFFAAALRLMGNPDPTDVVYVGDRPDNDIKPAAAAGMRTIWLRRGPWGLIWQEAPEANVVVDSLEEAARRVGEAWPAAPTAVEA
jgi:HAD superfamily hydrolase (TIGR01662 family)